MNSNFKKYILFWLSGSISQLGSAMTGFALILWTYTQTRSAMTVSVMTFCSYLPYIFASDIAGGFIDRHFKKKIMLTADFMAAVCSLAILITWSLGELRIWHIYIANCITGFMNSFQSPAQSVAVGILVPKEKTAQASGMDSFSGNLVSVVSPVLASALFAFGGLSLVIIVDIMTFLFAFLILLLFISIPETLKDSVCNVNIFSGSVEGFKFLRRNRGLWCIIITLAVINFFSRISYENILSPMILARSGNNSIVLGFVNAFMGAGGIIGGLIISTGKIRGNRIKMIYFSAAFSFLCGDMMMGAGRNVFLWCIAGAAASAPIPFMIAGQRMILYEQVPRDKQGSVFSIRNAIQHSMIPVGILLGGFLADYVFEPFMRTEHALARYLHYIVGYGEGSGMAVMFLCTGFLGFTFSLFAYRRKEIQELKGME